ncbi:hypothetical protein L9F63_014169, partial [Diploptera punctata]
RRLRLLLMHKMKRADGHGVETGPDLDEEMEKVFAMAEDDRFDVSKFAASPDSNSSKRSFNEKDYSQRKNMFGEKKPSSLSPYKNSISREKQTLKLFVGKTSEGGRRFNNRCHFPILAANEARKLSNTGTDSDTGWSSPPLPLHPTINEDNSISESEAQVSERAAQCIESPDFGSPDLSRRVQFQIGYQPIVGPSPFPGKGPSHEKKKLKRKHSRHHHRRKYSLQEGSGHRQRVRAGSDFGIGNNRRISIRPEEASMLEEQDIDDLTSHRFDDAKGLRRYKIQSKMNSSSMVHIGRKDGESLQTVLPLQTLKKMIDHSPHEVFVQLDELHGEGDEREWKETARWIKYEEDVEEGAERWGRPHVASLSFHSLLNLRRCLETGVVLLDLEEKDLPGVAYRVVEQMVVDELIDPEDKPTVMRALLLRHRHVNEHDRFRFGMRRTFSSYTSLQNLADDKGKPKIVPSVITKPENHNIDMKEELTYTSSAEDLKRAAKESILKRIPIGAEATTVLVGAVDFLEQPTIAFVRLAEGILMPSITEVTIPVRFLFILLGPSNADLDYHEIGRSISTLMSNAHFHKIAYKADERKELLSAINEFLDDSIVLPPGDWKRKNLLPFGELKAKSDMIRKRKNTRLMQKDDEKKALLALDGGDGKPPADDPLRRTRRPFGGLVNDIKRRFPRYKSDVTDGFNLQCLAAAIFMYFAALSGAITFGGLMGDKTDNLIGTSETLISTSAAGIIFALVAGQPLIIIGTTGPLLLFDESLYNFCVTNGFDFLTLRVYIGVWLGIIGIIVVCFEGSVLVKLFTRFTEEIFAALISVLYIVESIMKMVVVFHEHPLMADYCSDPIFYIDTELRVECLNALDKSIHAGTDDVFTKITEVVLSLRILVCRRGDNWIRTDQPNTALFCLILALGTFFIAYYLRQFRNSKFLGRSARRALGDFGVPIAIISMVTMDYLVPQTYTEKLKVPEGLSPSSPDVRGWIIVPVVTHIWLLFAAAAPALLVYILLFMETHIC